MKSFDKRPVINTGEAVEPLLDSYDPKMQELLLSGKWVEASLPEASVTPVLSDEDPFDGAWFTRGR
ncbi:MAG TPA: hypothetical protein VF572_04135 [Candidatus Saccharimonadales bacterium]|jgi:hypothetical protein